MAIFFVVVPITILSPQATHISATKCIDHCRGAEAAYALVSATKCSCASAHNFALATTGSPVKSMGDCARSTTNQMIGDSDKGTVAFYNLVYGDPTLWVTFEFGALWLRYPPGFLPKIQHCQQINK